MILVAEAMADPDRGIAGLFTGDHGEAKPPGTVNAGDLAA
jgi:hypothetical protein